MSNNTLGKHTSAVACLTCRERHLRCDGRKPTCTRCSAAGMPCVFLPSRRGYRGGKRKQITDGVHGTTCASPTSDALSMTVGNLAEKPLSHDGTVEPVTPPTTPAYTHDYLIDVFYAYVHPAHPFILPRTAYRADPSVLPDYLKSSMRYIAVFFTDIDRETYRQKATSILYFETPDTIFKVQALILLTLASFASLSRADGITALTQAIQISNRIGHNLPSSALGQSNQLQESWNRTWWELYTTSGLITVITGHDVKLPIPEGLPLPSRGDDYERGTSKQARTILDMQDRFFSEDDYQWSSFAYKIEATRILMSASEASGPVPRCQVEGVKASIASFILSIPHDKQKMIKDNGDPDEVMFSAYLTMHLASLLLHVPRSSLLNARAFATVCGTGRSGNLDIDAQQHMEPAMSAAAAMAKLLSNRSASGPQSPCLSCMIAFGTTTELSAFLVSTDPVRAQHLRENIQLELSYLNVVGEVWPVGRCVKSQLAQFAKQILKPRQQPKEEPPLPTIDMDTALDGESWLSDLLQEPIPDVGEPFSFANLGT